MSVMLKILHTHTHKKGSSDDINLDESLLFPVEFVHVGSLCNTHFSSSLNYAPVSLTHLCGS